MDDVLNKVAIEQALALQPPAIDAAIRLLSAYDELPDYEGPWPPRWEDVYTYCLKKWPGVYRSPAHLRTELEAVLEHYRENPPC